MWFKKPAPGPGLAGRLDQIDPYAAASAIASVIQGAILYSGPRILQSPNLCIIWGLAGTKGFALSGALPSEGEFYVLISRLPQLSEVASALQTVSVMPADVQDATFTALVDPAIDQLAIAAWQAYKVKFKAIHRL